MWAYFSRTSNIELTVLQLQVRLMTLSSILFSLYLLPSGVPLISSKTMVSKLYNQLNLFQHNSGGRSTSNAFLLPQWGGIVIHNPPLVESADLSPQDLNLYFSSFSNQLLALLGVAKLPPGFERSNLDHTDVLSDWQLDALLRRRTFENAQGSQDTLSSIVKLIDRIENMPIGDGVRDDVQNALHALMKASDYAKCGHDYPDSNRTMQMFDSSSTSLHQTFAYSTEALSLASRAFFNPGMLALLYFPAEHKYAVYTPLFASTIIPLTIAALREIVVWRRERKAP